MTSAIDRIYENEERLKRIEEALHIGAQKEQKPFKMRIPSKILGAVRKDTVTSVGLWLGHNREAEFRKVTYKDGLLVVGDQRFAYEKGGVYQLRLGKKRLPLIVVFEWRLLPAGGSSEEYRSRLVGDVFDEQLAEQLGIRSTGQQTMIRAIEQAEIEKDQPKKSGFSSWIIWGIVIVAVIYFVSKFFTGGAG